MKRTTVFLEESLQRELTALAKRQARPAAALVREAIGQYVVSQQAANPTPLSFVAVGGSGRTDTAELHEDLLFTDLHLHGEAEPRPARNGKALARDKRPIRRRSRR